MRFPRTTVPAPGLVLRPLGPGDLDAITRACRDEDTQRWLPLPRPYGRADARRFVEVFAPQVQARGTGIVFAIDVGGELVGCVDLKNTDWQASTTEIGYWVAPWARGRGLATRATRRLAEWALRQHGFERVTLRVQPGNLASMSVARSAGFVAEGMERSAALHRDRRIDLLVFSLVSADLRAAGAGEEHAPVGADAAAAGGEARDIVVVGIGADGWAGLSEAARAALRGVAVVIGGTRQLDLLPAQVEARRLAWPRALRASVRPLVAEHAPSGLAILASGDPMHYGVGRTLAQEVGADRLRVFAHPSSISLACARLGLGIEEVDVVSVVGRDTDTLAARLHPRRPLLVLSAGADTPAALARILLDRGFGDSRLVVLGDLGAPGESRVEGRAADWARTPPPDLPALNVLAIQPVRDAGTPRLGVTGGLPDEVYATDGQLTKREVRAVTLAALAPEPGELLWDVGAGSGSVGIEWMRAHPTCRAVAIEPRADRRERIEANARRLGVPGLGIVAGHAPAALAGLERPDAVFVGGGVTEPGLVEACWDALPAGGRLVANTVTLESEAALAARHAVLGGRLVRLGVSRAGPVGRYTAWAPARPVTQWAAAKC